MTTLDSEHERFLALHSRHLVMKWQWIFRGGTLRAEAGRHVAFISLDGFRRLVDAGLIKTMGCAGVRLTDEGKRVAANVERTPLGAFAGAGHHRIHGNPDHANHYRA